MREDLGSGSHLSHVSHYPLGKLFSKPQGNYDREHDYGKSHDKFVNVPRWFYSWA